MSSQHLEFYRSGGGSLHFHGDRDSDDVATIQQVASFQSYRFTTKRHQDQPIPKKPRIQWGLSNREYQHESDLSGSSDESLGTRLSLRRIFKRNQNISKLVNQPLNINANRSIEQVPVNNTIMAQQSGKQLLSVQDKSSNHLVNSTNSEASMQNELLLMQETFLEYHTAQLDLSTKVLTLQTETNEIHKSIA